MMKYRPIRLHAVWYFGVAVVTGAVIVAVGAAVAVSSHPSVSGHQKTSGTVAATFTNPVFTPELGDPSVIRDAATRTWYAYGTSDYWTRNPSSLHVLPILESKDLTHWTFVRNVFSKAGTAAAADSPDQPKWTGSPALWWPDVRLIDGKYVMYYTASNTAAGGYAIGVATASNPAGPWTDSGGPLIAPLKDPQGSYYAIIDPSEVQAPDGQRYLYYGSDSYGIRVVQLAADGLAVKPGSTPVKVAETAPFVGLETAPFNTPAVVYHNGYYYLFASAGNCCNGPNSDVDVVVDRSVSPLGPFTDQLGIPLLQGGASVVVADNGDGLTSPSSVAPFQDGTQWWMGLDVVSEKNGYLASGSTARQLSLEPLDWTASGWPVVNGGRGVTVGPQPAPGSPLAASSGPGSLSQVPVPGAPLPAYSQDFNTAKLGAQWSWVNEDAANWSLSQKPGTLTIDGVTGAFWQGLHTGQNVLLENAPQGNFIAQTQVAVNPTENFSQAGLMLWQNEDTYVQLVADAYAGLDQTEWDRQFDVTSPYAGFHCGAAYPANTCPVYGDGLLETPGFSPAAHAAGGNGTWTWLRIAKIGDTVTAYTSLNGQSWTPGATYDLSGFTAGKPLKIGLVARGTPGAVLVAVPSNFAYLDVYPVSGSSTPAAGAS